MINDVILVVLCAEVHFVVAMGTTSDECREVRCSSLLNTFTTGKNIVSKVISQSRCPLV